MDDVALYVHHTTCTCTSTSYSGRLYHVHGTPLKASDVDIDKLGKAENAEVGPDIDQLSRSECQGQTNGGSIGGWDQESGNQGYP